MRQNPKEKEFLEAYEKYADDIYRHCYFRVYNKELAEDLTQETFIKTWKYIIAGKEIKNIRAFLYKVAVNLIIDNSRKKKTLPLDDDVKEGREALRLYNIGSVNVEGDIFNSFESKELIKMFDELNDNYKQVLLMRYVDDLSPGEIAEILEETPNAVSVRINQAMKKLREVVDRHYHNKNEK